MVGVARGELTDAAWADHRRVINGILWKLLTGAPWRRGATCPSGTVPGRPLMPAWDAGRKMAPGTVS